MKNIILVVVLHLTFITAASAQVNLITEDVMGPFPSIESMEEKNDIDTMLLFQKSRTKEQCAKAEIESNVSLDVFFGGLLSGDEMKVVQKRFRKLILKAGTNIYYYKNKYNRPRPYLYRSDIKPCIDLENSKAYPSGHATIARVFARVLGIVYPERSLQFINRSDEIATNRVLGGVHHPSDIVAGKLLGDAIADEYLSLNRYHFEL